MTLDPAARRAEPARGGQHSFIEDLPKAEQAVAQQATLTTEEIVRLARNAFDIAWLPEPARQSMIAKAFTR
jgi:adenosine deaminase